MRHEFLKKLFIRDFSHHSIHSSCSNACIFFRIFLNNLNCFSQISCKLFFDCKMLGHHTNVNTIREALVFHLPITYFLHGISYMEDVDSGVFLSSEGYYCCIWFTHHLKIINFINFVF